MHLESALHLPHQDRQTHPGATDSGSPSHHTFLGLKPLEPFTQSRVQRTVPVCKDSHVAKADDRGPYRTQRTVYGRDRGLTMLLLDFGNRTSKLCALWICNINLKTGEGKADMAKKQNVCRY